MRAPKESDYPVSVDGVGEFVFGRMTYGDRLAVRARYMPMARAAGIPLDEDEPSPGSDAAVDFDERQYLRWLLKMTAKYQVMVVSCPKGWEDLAGMDLLSIPNMPERDAQISEVFRRWGETEDSFRRGD